MKLYNNVPQAIREGIFCLMTGTLVFAANGITAEASDGIPEDDSSDNNAAEAVQNSVADQAAAIIENTDDSLENVKTEVKVVENTKSPEELTKDTENVTVVEEGNTVTTTGEYVEDVYTKETTSTTVVTTPDEKLAEEIKSQVEKQSNNNTENSGIEFDSITKKYYITDNQGNRVSEIEDPEALGGADKFILETKEGSSESKVIAVIGDEEVPLTDAPDEIKEALENENTSYALDNRIEYSLGGTTLTSKQTDLLTKNSIAKDTTFIIAPSVSCGEKYDITYVEDGVTKTVTDTELKELILGSIENIEEKVKKYEPQKEYVTAEAAESEMEEARKNGYALVTVGYGTETHSEAYASDIIYETEDEAKAAKAALEADGYKIEIVTHPLPEERETGIITNFSGYKVTSEAEYNRIIALKDKEVVDGETIYKETKSDGTTVYYKVNSVDESFTILAVNGTMTQHQECSYIVGGRYYYYDEHNNIRSSTSYGIDTSTYVNEMNKILSTEKTADNTLNWYTGVGERSEKNKIDITKGGTYYVDGTVGDTFIRIATSEKVTVILTGDKVTMPIVTTKSNYQSNQTGNHQNDFGGIRPDITFVTGAKEINVQCENNVGNILAPNSKVTLNSGNFSGTIICNEINGAAEGHWSTFGSKGFLVDSKVVGATGRTYYTLAGNKTVKNYVVSGIMTDSVLLDKTEYTRSLTMIDSLYEVKFIKYTKESRKGTWTETKTVDIPDTPPSVIVVPPTPPTPPTLEENPPVDPPVDNTVIVRAEDPQVLGATRDLPQVLGARRARTDDMAQNPLVASMIILSAASVALGALSSLRKRR